MAKNVVPNLCLVWLGNFEKLKKFKILDGYILRKVINKAIIPPPIKAIRDR